MSINNLAIKSGNVFEYSISGEVQITKSASVYTKTETIPHNLGYTPLCDVFVTVGSGFTYLPYIYLCSDLSGNIAALLDFEIDETNLYINIRSSDRTSNGYAENLSYIFRYFIYRMKTDE